MLEVTGCLTVHKEKCCVSIYTVVMQTYHIHCSSFPRRHPFICWIPQDLLLWDNLARVRLGSWPHTSIISCSFTFTSTDFCCVVLNHWRKFVFITVLLELWSSVSWCYCGRCCLHQAMSTPSVRCQSCWFLCILIVTKCLGFLPVNVR
jgi:hypothetical protein